MPANIALGTKEYLQVEVTDLSDQITDLSTHSPKYTVQDDTNAYKYNDATAIATGMTIYALIDTTSGWVVGHYRLWVRFTTAPEIPYLGPYDFYVQ